MYAVQRASTSAVLASLLPPAPPPSRADAPVAARSGAGLPELASALPTPLLRLLAAGGASAARLAGGLAGLGLGPGSDPFPGAAAAHLPSVRQDACADGLAGGC